MASLVLNQNILNNQAKPSLDQAKRYLNQARSKCNSLSIPTSFLYRKYLKNIANSLLEIENDINSSKNKIDNTISQYNGVETRTSNKVRSLTAMVSSSTYNIGNSKTATSSNSLSKKVVDDIKKTAAKVGEAVSSFIKKAKNWFSEKVDDAKKTAAKVGEAISTFAKKVENWTVEKIGDIKKTAAKVGETVSGWCKGAWNWISNVAAPAVWDVLKKTGSLVAVAVQSIVAGVLEVVEAAVDLVALVRTGVASAFTGIWDAGQAIYGAITGNEWHSATKAMWKETKSFVSTTWVRNGYNALSNTAYGKWLNENSFGDWARTDGMFSQVAEGIGYTAGVIALSVVTFGAATPLVLATTASSLAVSKYTEEAWNNNKISIDTGNGNYDMSLNYDELSTLNNEGKLKKQIEQTDELGNVITTEVIFVKNEDGSYLAIINGQKLNCNVDETGILEGLSYGAINGAWEFGQWYLGGQIGSGQFKCLTGGIKSAAMQKLAVSGTRVVLDSVTGAVETPFRTLLDTMYSDMTLEEAWNKNGGWNGVLSQTLIAGIMSAGGELFDLGKSKLFKKKQTDVDINIKSNSSEVDLNSEYIINSDISKKYKNADELYQAYISGKTKMNTKEYAEAMDFFNVRDKISLKNKTGIALEELFSDDDYIIGVHRAGNGNAQSILDNGLFLTGHNSSGGFTGSVDLKNNITFHDDYFGFVKALSEGSSYKTGGVGFGDAVIVKIPKSDIKNFDKILDFSNTTPVLKSDYIVGSISSYIDSNGKIHLMDVIDIENNKMREITELSLDKYGNAKKLEPNITSQLQYFEDENSKLVGLEYRFKIPESLSRKIESDALADNISYKQAANNIGDSLRYTFQITDSDYSDQVVDILKKLEAEGYTVNKFKNFWGNAEYQGINVSLVSPEGLKMELQFHTESSFYTKEVLNHKYYEIKRSITSTETEKIAAKQIMEENQSKVSIPSGIVGLEWK